MNWFAGVINGDHLIFETTKFQTRDEAAAATFRATRNDWPHVVGQRDEHGRTGQVFEVKRNPDGSFEYVDFPDLERVMF